MTFEKKTILLASLLMAACFSAAAQDKVMKFTLAQEARIGGNTVPAGEYRMVVSTDGHVYAVVSPENRRGSSVIAVPVSYGYSSSCTSDSLTLSPNGSTRDVTSVCFSESETALTFALEQPGRLKWQHKIRKLRRWQAPGNRLTCAEGACFTPLTRSLRAIFFVS